MDTAADSANYVYEDIGECPSFIDQPQAFAEYQIKEHLITKHLLDGEEDSYEYCHFLVATYHSPTPSDWTYKIYLQYLMNSSALDHVHVLFKEPEEIDLDGLKELFEDSICNEVAVEVVDSDDKAFCADKLLCNGEFDDSVISEDWRDDKSLSIVPYASGDLQGNASGTKMINYAIIDDYYRAAVALGRIITQIMDYNEREYIRFLYDRGRRAN